MKKVKVEKTQTKARNFLGGMLLAASMIVMVCILYANSIRETSKNEVERYLGEVSSSVADFIESKIGANMAALRSIAITYSEQKRRGMDDIDYLQKKAECHDFIRISILTKDGQSVGSDGTTYDFSDEPKVMKVFEGIEIIENGTEEYSGNKSGFYYAVPVYDSNNQVSCALVASNTTTWIQDFISKEYFDKKAFFHIIEKDGTIVIKSENPSVILEGDNFIDGMKEDNISVDSEELEQFSNDILNKNEGLLYFKQVGTSDDETKIARSVNIEGTKFLLVLVVIDGVASDVFNQLLNNGILVVGFVSGMLIIIIVVVFLSFRNVNNKLYNLAFVDPITKGDTGTRFDIEAQELIQNNPLDTYAFLVLNVAKFKLINDSYGIDEGNRTLEYIYRVIKNNLYNGEIVSRATSDRFDILIKSNKEDDILRRIDEIIKDINGFNGDRTDKYYLNFQIGAYIINDDKVLSTVYIRDRANTARQNAGGIKGTRLFVCSFFSDEERKRQYYEKYMENKMEDALEKGEFKVYFQPKLDLTNNEIVGAEALVRWLDPDRGLIPPNDFIPFFELKGFIVNLDLYVFEETCKRLRKWIDQGNKPIVISVNLSRVHLRNKDFIKPFSIIRDYYNIPQELLEIELTETIIVNGEADVKAAVDAIHGADFGCSIDDFGSGYSSLNMLKEINADVLKIDKAFFGINKEFREREKAIVKFVVDLARNLGMKSISEGVETIQQLEFLREINCDMVQGYIISRPIPMDEFEEKFIKGQMGI